LDVKQMYFISQELVKFDTQLMQNPALCGKGGFTKSVLKCKAWKKPLSTVSILHPSKKVCCDGQLAV
jgi:hypothetical protein